MPETCHRVGTAAPRHHVYEEFATKGGLVKFWTLVDHSAVRYDFRAAPRPLAG